MLEDGSNLEADKPRPARGREGRGKWEGGARRVTLVVISSARIVRMASHQGSTSATLFYLATALSNLIGIAMG